MVTKVEHFGPTPACQPQKIEEITLQVQGAQRECGYGPQPWEEDGPFAVLWSP